MASHEAKMLISKTFTYFVKKDNFRSLAYFLGTDSIMKSDWHDWFGNDSTSFPESMIGFVWQPDRIVNDAAKENKTIDG